MELKREGEGVRERVREKKRERGEVIDMVGLERVS